MTYLKVFGRFWYDFIVGDDWKVALGAVTSIGLAYLTAHRGENLWWLLPGCVAMLLWATLLHATRRSSS